MTLPLRTPSFEKPNKTPCGVLAVVDNFDSDNELRIISAKMCIRLKRRYLSCGHELEKIVRCALPYYWLKNRKDEYESPYSTLGMPPRFFDAPADPVNETDATPYFGCFDCLDEIEEQYSLSCPECSGQGSVHSERDVVSRNGTKYGMENKEAYEVMKHNYHRYLVDFLQYFPRHCTYLHHVEQLFNQKVQRSPFPVPDYYQAPNHPLWQDAMSELGPTLWCGPDNILSGIMDKLLAEVKCRQEKTHPPPDAGLEWSTKETHLGEHIPALNNVSTALRRTLALDLERHLREWLQMYWIPESADDYDEHDDDESQMYNDQPFLTEVEEYQNYMSAFRSDGIAGPYNPGKGPYDILEFVPQISRTVLDQRMQHLQSDLMAEMTRAEIEAPRGDDTIRGRRALDLYARQEDFVSHTIGFIFQLLALDPGLSGARMLDIARMFHSVLMEPWYEIYGHPESVPILDSAPIAARDAGQPAQGHEAVNLELRDSLLDLVETKSRGGMQLPPELNWWWERLSYHAVQIPGSARQTVNLGVDMVFNNASSFWITFYKNWLQILANVELNHTKLTHQQLDNESEKSCPICGDDYDVDHEFNCPVYYRCPNNHTLDKKCYTTLSLTPTRPYNKLQSDKFCPTCRAQIPYDEALNTNLLADAQFLPTLNAVELDPESFRR